MRRLNHGVVILCSLLAASPVHAVNEGIREHISRKACLSGDYIKGVDILSDLYLDTKNSTYLFNQGRCYEQNGRYEEAIARFREYLRKTPNLSPALEDDTQKHITECQNLLTAALVSKPPSSSLSKVNEADVASTPLTPKLDDSQKGLRISGIAFGITSLLSTGVGVYYYTQARSYTKKVNDAEVPSRADDKAGKNAVTMQWVFYSVGAASLITGGVLSWLGWPRSAKGHTAGLMPMVSFNTAGVLVQGGY